MANLLGKCCFIASGRHEPRWCENVRDRVAGFRILQLLPGIGPTTAAKVLDKIEAAPSLKKALSRIDIPKAAAENWPAFTNLLIQLTKANNGSWPAEYASVSRFIPRSIQDCFESRTWSDRAETACKPAIKSTTRINVAANASRMWR